MKNNEHDDDLSQARAWLAMDPREHANRVAEMTKRRNAARAYGPDKSDFQKHLERGDMGSMVEPICLLTFCSKCDDSINDYNRSPIYGICTVCLRDTVKPEPKPTALPSWFYPTIILAAVLFGGAVGWILPRIAWAVGHAW